MSYSTAIDRIRDNYYLAAWLDERVRSHVRRGHGRAATTRRLAARRDRLMDSVGRHARLASRVYGVPLETVMRDVRPW